MMRVPTALWRFQGRAGRCDLIETADEVTLLAPPEAAQIMDSGLKKSARKTRFLHRMLEFLDKQVLTLLHIHTPSIIIASETTAGGS